MPATTTTTAPGSAANDKVLLRTAQSIEILAIDTYQKALDSDLLTEPVGQGHRHVCSSRSTRTTPTPWPTPIRTAGGKPVTAGNEYLASRPWSTRPCPSSPTRPAS